MNSKRSTVKFSYYFHIFLIFFIFLNNVPTNLCQEKVVPERETLKISSRDRSHLEDDTITIVILVHPYNKLSYLPYLFGSIESQFYDHKRVKIHLITDRLFESSGFRNRKNTYLDHDDEDFWTDPRLAQNDKTLNILKFWTQKQSKYFSDVKLTIHNQELGSDSGYYDELDPESYWNNERFQKIINIKNIELSSGYDSWSDYVLFWDADVILINPYTLTNLTQIFYDQPEVVVVAPMLNSFDSYSNFWGDMNEKNFYKRSEDYFDILKRKLTGIFVVPMIHTLFMIHTKKITSRALTFDPNELESETKLPFDDVIAFAKSAEFNSIKLHLDNRLVYGYIPSSMPDKIPDIEETKQRLIDLELLSLHEGPPFPVSSLLEQFIQPAVPFPDKLNVDQIYIVNLRRRPERKERMEKVLRLMKIDAQFWTATDGKVLNQTYLDRYEIKTLPGYSDPYSKRSVTFGEIGCFLSHYRIWEDAYRNNYTKVRHNFRQFFILNLDSNVSNF